MCLSTHLNFFFYHNYFELNEVDLQQKGSTVQQRNVIELTKALVVHNKKYPLPGGATPI